MLPYRYNLRQDLPPIDNWTLFSVFIDFKGIQSFHNVSELKKETSIRWQVFQVFVGVSLYQYQVSVTQWDSPGDSAPAAFLCPVKAFLHMPIFPKKPFFALLAYVHFLVSHTIFGHHFVHFPGVQKFSLMNGR